MGWWIYLDTLDSIKRLELNQEGTKSINKTLAILASFTDDAPQQRTTDIAAKLGLTVSTVSRHLGTLLDWGFLERDDMTGYYRPGSRIITLAGIAFQNNPVYRHAAPEMRELASNMDANGHIAVPNGTFIMHLISVGSANAKALVPTGYMQPMFCTAIGRAMLAYMPQARVMGILHKSELFKRTEATKTDIDEILSELKKVRRKGYCLLVDELNYGRSSVSVPIFDRHGTPVAGISLATNTYRLSSPETELQFSQALKKVGNKVSGILGYYPR